MFANDQRVAVISRSQQIQTGQKDNIKNISVLTFYWSSTQVADDPKSAWHIFYKYGESYYGSKVEKYGVRCIRDK